MAKLLIQTQTEENYGSKESPHWKMKGGNDYVVKNFTAFGAVGSFVTVLREKIEIDNEFFKEYILDWEIVSDDYLTHDERLQLKYDGKITFPAIELTYGGKPVRNTVT